MPGWWWWREGTRLTSNWRGETWWEGGSTPLSPGFWCSPCRLGWRRMGDDVPVIVEGRTGYNIKDYLEEASMDSRWFPTLKLEYYQTALMHLHMYQTNRRIYSKPSNPECNFHFHCTSMAHCCLTAIMCRLCLTSCDLTLMHEIQRILVTIKTIIICSYLSIAVISLASQCCVSSLLFWVHKCVKKLSVQRLTLLALNGRHFGYITEVEGPPALEDVQCTQYTNIVKCWPEDKKLPKCCDRPYVRLRRRYPNKN